MKRAAAVLLAVIAVVWGRAIGPVSTVGSAGTALALGFALLGAWVVGDALRYLKLPRVSGYLLFGVLVGPYLGNVITGPMAAQLQVVTGIATTLIALIAGLMFSVTRLGQGLKAILALTGTTLTLLIASLGIAAWLFWGWLPIAPDASGLAKLAMVGLLAVIAASFSPTMTAAVLTETDARGRFSETTLAVVILADLIVLLLFSLSLPLARAALGIESGDGAGVLARLAWETGGAVAFGVFVGAMFALYLRYVGREVTLVVIAVCALLSQVGTSQQFEPLLAAVAAGFVIENLAPAHGDTLRAAVKRGAPPVLVIFFVAVGASLRIDAFAVVGAAALVIAAVRLLVLRFTIPFAARSAHFSDQERRYLWTGLVSQAGITLGFASVLATEFPSWGPQAQTLLVALIAIHELTGPILFRYGLARAGDLDPPATRPLVVVSNREPYLHERNAAGAISVTSATGGVAVALDALMRERAGVWIAHGAGSADRLVVDATDKVRVPPGLASYDLRRLWIDAPQFDRYYNGFANEGLWPLCHQVDVRPTFRAEDWAAYQAVNECFAAAACDELEHTGPHAPVFIQDYHLALVAPAIRARRPAARTALFWHIPWPYPDRLRICPWRKEILRGLLANDLLAFQLERDRHHFLFAVEEELDAEVDVDSGLVSLGGRTTAVVSVPIGVDYDRIQSIAAGPAMQMEQQRLKTQFNLDEAFIGVGVDRLDYTKGIPERLDALDAVLRARPDLRGRLAFVQIGVPSRSSVTSYAAIEAEIGRRVAEINSRHAVPGRPPVIRYSTQALPIGSLVALYRLSHFCIVSSLHDGMNLVAKEFVAARDDDDGVLVLSSLAGAAQELGDALLINPYDTDGFAGAILAAIDMPADERAARMRAMRRVVAGRDVFGWASDILEGLESLWSRPLHYSVRQWEDMSV